MTAINVNLNRLPKFTQKTLSPYKQPEKTLFFSNINRKKNNWVIYTSERNFDFTILIIFTMTQITSQTSDDWKCHYECNALSRAKIRHELTILVCYSVDTFLKWKMFSLTKFDRCHLPFRTTLFALSYTMGT